MEITKNTEYDEAVAAIENLLRAAFPKDRFAAEEKAFLARYTVIKKESEKEILVDILGKTNFTRVGDYYAAHPYVEKAKIYLQYLYKRFRDLCDRDHNPFGGIIGFLEWWYAEMDEQGEHRCYYCGVKESVSDTAFKAGKIVSKKFTGALQIDRKDPNKGYHKENCVFACVLCNNAKSDMISADDYKTYFGDATKAFWEHLSNAN